jgi:hypothetical protein
MRTLASMSQIVGFLSAVAAVELNEDNYERLTTGKTVFLKFCDPTYVCCPAIPIVTVTDLVVG